MINIQDIIPLLRDGYVACDWNGTWCWYEREPRMLKTSKSWVNASGTKYEYPYLFCFQDIAPADDWTKSLIKIDNTARKKFEEEYQNNIQKTIQELKQDD